MTRAEAMEVYKDRSAKFKNTQSLQWKLNLSIWTLLVLAIFNKGKMTLPGCDGTCISQGCGFEIIIGVLLVIFHSYFCYQVQKSLDSDKVANNYIVKQLNANIKPDLNIHVEPSLKPSSVQLSWVIIQSFITLVLVVVFCVSGKIE